MSMEVDDKDLELVRQCKENVKTDCSESAKGGSTRLIFLEVVAFGRNIDLRKGESDREEDKMMESLISHQAKHET